MARAGRRPGRGEARSEIVDVARDLFAMRGLEGASVRAIAAAAGVDPALVHHYFGGKEALFEEAMRLPLTAGEVVPDLVAGDLSGLGRRVARNFLAVWDQPERRTVLVGIARSAPNDQRAQELLSAAVMRFFVTPIAAVMAGPDVALRVALIGSQLLGVVMARYVLAVEPLASAPAERVVSLLGATLQHCLDQSLNE